MTSLLRPRTATFSTANRASGPLAYEFPDLPGTTEDQPRVRSRDGDSVRAPFPANLTPCNILQDLRALTVAAILDALVDSVDPYFSSRPSLPLLRKPLYHRAPPDLPLLSLGFLGVSVPFVNVRPVFPISAPGGSPPDAPAEGPVRRLVQASSVTEDIHFTLVVFHISPWIDRRLFDPRSKAFFVHLHGFLSNVSFTSGVPSIFLNQILALVTTDNSVVPFVLDRHPH